MVLGFPFVVQAAVVNADWSGVVWALVRVCGSASGNGRLGEGGKRAVGDGKAGRRGESERSTLPSLLPSRGLGGTGTTGVKRVTLIVQNDGARIGEEERRNVEMLFEEKFWLIRDVLSVEFDP